MIIITVENLQDFFYFLKNRISDEIFYYFYLKIIENEKRVFLNFLGKLDAVIILYQIILKLPFFSEEKIKEELDKINLGNIKIIQGKITEMFISIS